MRNSLNFFLDFYKFYLNKYHMKFIRTYNWRITSFNIKINGLNKFLGNYKSWLLKNSPNLLKLHYYIHFITISKHHQYFSETFSNKILILLAETCEWKRLSFFSTYKCIKKKSLHNITCKASDQNRPECKKFFVCLFFTFWLWILSLINVIKNILNIMCK